MCGIAGIWNLDGRPCGAEEIRDFTDALTHRGPDGSGAFIDGPLALGHRRLAILDLSEHGKQPMSDPDGRFWITFNGEIYNFLEIRRELERDGHRFVSETDTEVIVAAYKRWGEQCVLRFNGMWAFAIWDSARRELLLSRDRFGVKPLRYMSDGKRFAFASELKAFRHLAGFHARENVAEMRNLLARGGMSMEETPLENVKRLPGGYHLLVKADGTMRKWRWWRTVDHLPEVPRSFREQVEGFRELFYDAVRKRLRSDVPVASALSGGLDSGSIVSALPDLARDRGERETADCHHAFVATFPGTSWDEREYAEAVIEKTGAQAHFVQVDPEMVLDGLEQYCYDIELCGDRLSIPLWLTYRALRRNNIVVSLDGHGGDEMLAGYARPYWHTLYKAGNVLRSPLRTLNLARTVQGIYTSGTARERPLWSILAATDPTFNAGRRAMAKLRGAVGQRVGGSAAPTVPNGNGYSAGGPRGWTDAVPRITYMDEDTREIVDSLGPFKGYLYTEFHATTLVNVLRTFDRCSMAHGVELRMPFLDWRLVCYSFALPESTITGAGYTKYVLREAMRGALPEKVRTRKGKIGFSSPLPNWFNGPVGDWVVREVQTPEFLRSELWNGPAIRDFAVERNTSKQWTNEAARNVWRFVQANRWRTALGHA